jgi:hypothetical protein
VEYFQELGLSPKEFKKLSRTTINYLIFFITIKTLLSELKTELKLRRLKKTFKI